MGRGSAENTVNGVPALRNVRRSFYRAGGIDKPADYGPAQEAYMAADGVRPEGRVGRLEGLFCVESVAEVTRWVHGSMNAGSAYDPNPREIFYEGPEPWIYPVTAWSSIGLHENGDSAIYRRHYWDLGLPLSEFEARRQELAKMHLWRDGGEILLDPRFIRSSRPVSLKRLAEQAPAVMGDVASRLKAWRRRHGHSDRR
jgi:hypothetical protein